MDEVEEFNFLPDQVVIATDNFTGDQPGDLPFNQGDRITIIRPTHLLYWYLGKTSDGNFGQVPATHLRPADDTECPPPLPPKPIQSPSSPDGDIQDYLKMGSGGATGILPKRKPTKQQKMSSEEKEMLKILDKEKQRRLTPGTLVVATSLFRGQKNQDMSFSIHEEMTIQKPMPDLCWYYAKKVENPNVKGVIPITHVRLVYMSDDEDNGDQAIYSKPKEPGHEKLYYDKNDFISNSGWYTFTGKPMGKESLINVLAKKAQMTTEKFMSVKESVYVLSYKDEMVYVGKAESLYDEMMKHFDAFGKPRAQISEVDDALCHHTDSAGWNLKVIEVQPEELELSWNKAIIEHSSICNPNNTTGLNERLHFTNMETFDSFWEWLSPN